MTTLPQNRPVSQLPPRSAIQMLANRLASLPSSNNTPQPAQQPQTRPANNPFGSRPASNTQPAANRSGAAPAPAAPLQNHVVEPLNWTTQPIYKTVVRFELNGLGDPFYRLLGHELNTEYGDSRTVARLLEQGGDAVSELVERLDADWDSYDLRGASLVYAWNPVTWKNLAYPTPMPLPPGEADWLNDDQNQGNTPNQPAPKPPAFTCIRAIDPALVLNVLARARSQVLLITAPLVFSQQYLNRLLVTDDPRLVALARATGCLDEGWLLHA